MNNRHLKSCFVKQIAQELPHVFSMAKQKLVGEKLGDKFWLSIRKKNPKLPNNLELHNAQLLW